MRCVGARLLQRSRSGRIDGGKMALKAVAFATASLLGLQGCSLPGPVEPEPIASAPAIAPDRVVPLEGAANFRDLGGYRTSEGRIVHWGKVYRSSSLSGVTSGDLASLRRMGIASVHDLRSTSERVAAPYHWTDGTNLEVHSVEYNLDLAGFMAALREGGQPVTIERARAVTAAMYRDVPNALAENYRILFSDLARADGPVVMNCSAGKDRTGLGAALFLLALKVPRETVMADYLLSNQHYRDKVRSGSGSAMLPGLSPEVMDALAGVDASYLAASLEAIEQRYGSVDAYLDGELGLTPAVRTQLIEKYSAPGMAAR